MLKEKIQELLMSTKREGILNLLGYMENQGFYTAPCSTQYHLSKVGGLAEHSLNVYNTMFKLAAAIASHEDKKIKSINYESIAIVGLLHDIGKIGQFGKPNYVPNMIKSRKKDEGLIKSANRPFVINPDILKIPHEIRTLQIITQFIKITEEEQFAIMYHADVAGDFKYIVADKQRPLQLLLFMADYWSSRVTEV